MPTPESQAQGQRLLTAVERLLAPDAVLLDKVENAKAAVPRADLDEDAWTGQVADRLIKIYSRRSAISGGAVAVPAILPGLGTLASLVGGTLADVALMLKYEVELALSLTALYGYDIRNERERQIAFLMASVATYGVRANRSLLVDLVSAEGTAIWNYTPRKLSKGLISALTEIALLSISDGFARVVPFVGVAVGASVNKVLTRRVGRRCKRELVLRRRLDAEAAAKPARKAAARSNAATGTKRAAKAKPAAARTKPAGAKARPAASRARKKA